MIGIANDQNSISKQKFDIYVNEKKKSYNDLLQFLENPQNKDDDFINLFNLNKEEGEKEQIENLLQLSKSISDNHKRDDCFLRKLFAIVEHYKDQIKQTLSNIEIFEIFRTNKLFLLFLLESQIIIVDDYVYGELNSQIELNGNKYCHFFYPEIKEFVGEEKSQNILNDLLSIDTNILDHFNEKRHEGENDSYICSLIRKDSVEEFISYVNRTNMHLKSRTKSSLFESNQFLICNTPTLIEYSAFFGSIQIFQYLRMNGVKLTESLWPYAIHSNNAELIYILEENKVGPPNGEYKICLIESIKCHHNNIANYIRDFWMPDDFKQEQILSSIMKYHNYECFPSDFKYEREFKKEFLNLCSFNYHTFVRLFLEKEKLSIENKIQKEINNKSIFITCQYKMLPNKIKLTLSIIYY